MSVEDEQEEQFLASVGLTGRFAVPPPGQDYLSVRVFNGNGNKIDAYLRRTVEYSATVDPATGRVDAVATVRLVNEATPPGISTYVTGNNNGDPDGTNRLYLSLYSPLDLVSAERDGGPLSVEPQREFGGNVLSAEVVIAPGATATLKFRLGGLLARDGSYELLVLPQALPHVDSVDVHVAGAPGAGTITIDAGPDGAVIRDGALAFSGAAPEPIRTRARFGAT